ncbi:copper amine oxidase N-terminal domain-containing protein [Paenibacillus amylolyticus]|uniref:copper amine oxidase N-terminal domain-containing protein n=1 Tax=Paenibacillus amylolyticus TaxID=1451 RepID=UPI00201D9C31|nr:copper amine oxidase N-terminal domain-containing protein [Paenibacillus amylolyticus]MCL6663413.1 copper amine oxidase N-terminal domain-containing protein [Paenibacillus amylolyticus]
MKKKILISFFAVVIWLSAIVGLAFAKGSIKIVVNNQTITPDVAPRMIDNRVMVPISFVSKALGAKVSWDQQNQTVSIKDNNQPQQEDIWKEDLDLSGSSWSGVKNLIAVYIAGYDNRDDELIKSVTVDGFDMIPIGGIYPAIIDYNIIDAQSTKSGIKVRVKVISNEEKLSEEIWDFDITKGKIQKWGRVSSADIDSYTVFPGLSFKNN